MLYMYHSKQRLAISQINPQNWKQAFFTRAKSEAILPDSCFGPLIVMDLFEDSTTRLKH